MSLPLNHCDKCGSLTARPEDDFAEFICEDCEQNRAEAAWERYCEDFYGGSGPVTLKQRMAEAMRFK